MALAEVLLASRAYFSCVSHALSMEREEIMGLLLGDLERLPDGGGLRAVVWAITLLPRSEKKADRVEIDPEALASVADKAELMEKTYGRKTRVVGWYHSHPHITPFPSHVDLRTQGEFQGLEPGWVGLIFSVFNASSTSHCQTVQLHAFQSRSGTAVVQATAAKTASSEDDTSSSSSSDADLGSSSNLLDSAAFVHVHVPVFVVPDDDVLYPGFELTPQANPYSDVVALHRMLRLEERDLHEARCAGTPVVQRLYNAGIYQRSMAKALAGAVSPLHLALAAAHETNCKRLQQLQREEEELRRQLAAFAVT